MKFLNVSLDVHFAVANTLGAGLPERAYENALAHELTKVGLMVRQQMAIGVEYDGGTVGRLTPENTPERYISRPI